MTAMKEVHRSGWESEINPIALPASVRWPVLLIGRNSVMPWTIPRMIDSKIFTRSPVK